MYRAYRECLARERQREPPKPENNRPKCKLTYFPLRGRAELIRYIFAQGNIEYEDNRITGQQWASLKKETPFGGLPILEVDGQVLAQSMTIARFAAKLAGLTGKTPEEQALADSAVDAISEVYGSLVKVVYERNAGRRVLLQSVLLENILAPFLTNMERFLQANSSNSGFLVGSDVTWADLYLYLLVHESLEMIGIVDDVLAKHPGLKELINKVESLPRIKEWISRRPMDAFYSGALKYKLIYFDAKGYGEITRLIFAQADVPFIDQRMNREYWTKIKDDMPWQSVPALVADGQVVGQSTAIARFAAQETGLAGKTPEEEALADSVVDAIKDVIKSVIKARSEENEQRKESLMKRFVEEVLPSALSSLEAFLLKNQGGDGFLVGSDVTWADLVFFDFVGQSSTYFPKMLDKYPKLQSLYERVGALPNIKAWTDSRPAGGQAKPKYKLSYFPLRGRAELTRLIFAQSQVEYEDCRIPFQDWPKMKEENAFGQLPLLEVDGQPLAESMTMARYVANETGLTGKTPEEQALCDSAGDAMQDLLIAGYKCYMERDEERKALLLKTLREEQIPKVTGNLERFMAENSTGGEFLIGDEVTWADLCFFNMTDQLSVMVPDILEKSPKLVALQHRVSSLPNVKTWLDKRPADMFSRPKYKLMYFPIRGRAELIRLVFAQAKVAYEDCRIKFKDWPKKKEDTVFGTLPVLEVEGKPLGESLAIARYAAKETGLAGQTPEEEALCDSAVDALKDLLDALYKCLFEKDEIKKASLKKAFSEGQVPKVMGNLERLMEENGSTNGFLVGEEVTWADLCFLNVTDQMSPLVPNALEKFPQLSDLQERISSLPNVKEWLNTRPADDFPKPKYKLMYFPIRGRGELIRLIFAQGKVSYEDCRIKFEDWPKKKKDTVFGTLPVLEVGGQPLAESLTIARYAANETGLAGKTVEDQALCDSAVDAMQDLLTALYKCIFEKDEATKSSLMSALRGEMIPKVMGNLERFMENNNNTTTGFLVGEEVTWADLCFLNVTDQLSDMVPDVLEKFPKLLDLQKRIRGLPNVKAWLDTRPADDLPKPKYKLIYFPLRGRAELTRLIFAEGNVNYEDFRIKLEDWKKMKDDTQFGRLPVLEVGGQPLGESLAIARFAANETGLAGRTPEDQALCDSAVDAMQELKEAITKFYYEKDESKKASMKKTLIEETVPKTLGNIERFMTNHSTSDYLIGSELTWADLCLLDTSSVMTSMLDLQKPLGDHPKLEGVVKKVQESPRITHWIETRPESAY